jgi:MEDS: MEthanogen/methylotroph, DcmR Sensory domain
VRTPISPHTAPAADCDRRYHLDVHRAAAGSRSHTHICRVFDDDADFRAHAVDFLADGLERGYRVRYVAEGDEASLRADVAALERLPESRRPGAIDVQSVGGAYQRSTAIVDIAAQVAISAAATTAALADGFAGFRVAADCTSLVQTPEQLDAFARYEHLVDRYMTGAPFSGMCGYRRSALGDAAVTQLACLHPAGGGAEQAPFRVHALRGADVAISGELDLTTVELFATTIDRIGLHLALAEVVVDATDLAFADHRNLLVLEHLARRHDRSVVLRTARRWPERLVTALELTRVRVERVA